MRINSVNDTCISRKNFVNFSPVTPELTELICELLVRHGKKTGVFSRISPDILDRFSQSFRHMKALCVQMIDLTHAWQTLACSPPGIVVSPPNEQ